MLAAMVLSVAASIAFLVPDVALAQDDGEPPPGTEEPPPGTEEPPPGDEEPPPEEPGPEPAELTVWVNGLKGAKLPALRRTTAVGRVDPFVPGQRVKLRFVGGGKLVKRKNVNVRRVDGAEHGKFRLRLPRLVKPGGYRVRAVKRGSQEQVAARGASRVRALRFPALGKRDRGREVALFHRLLRRQGYHAPSGKRFTSGTARAVLAYRKVNRMARTSQATSRVFERLVRGKGRFKLRRPGAGRHVEVDRSRQVMVLAANRKPQHVFHISSGKRGTRSDPGHFRFFKRQPGYNNVRMLHSVYYNGSEAIHGYRQVPTLPASNGCIRSPIPNARFIYRWVKLGMSIFVY